MPERRAAVAVLVVAAATAIGLYVDGKQRDDLAYRDRIAACERGNLLRREFSVQTAVSREFMLSAAQARAAQGDNDIAIRYRELAQRVHTIPEIDCAATISKP